jgi:leucyl-tRNA synthetase
MATERYNPRDSEPRWQQEWDEEKVFETDNDDPREKYYVLEMFPYPSGRIHMGHVRNYAMGDVVARYKRAKGFSCCIRWAGMPFGMPAENAAKANKVHPREWTYANIATMRRSCSPWACRSTGAASSRPATPLLPAPAEAVPGLSSRPGWSTARQPRSTGTRSTRPCSPMSRSSTGAAGAPARWSNIRELTQWFFKITDFSQDLHDALEGLDRWPEKVRLMQKNWIGRSEGLLIRFALESNALAGRRAGDLHDAARHAVRRPSWRSRPTIRWPRRRPRTIRRSAGLHRGMQAATGTAQEHIDKAEKLGFDTGIRAVHPLDPTWNLPVYVANFVLMEYGTGAIFGCPAHDQRDLDFVNKYGLGRHAVVCPRVAIPRPSSSPTRLCR